MFKKIFALFFVSVFLCSCVETVVAGTVAGGVIINKENNSETKNIKQETKLDQNEDQDKEIKNAVRKVLKSEENSSVYRNINIVVLKEKILLTGYVRDIKYKKVAMDIISKSQPNNEIIDEILVIGPNEKISGVNDYFISQSISIRLKKIKNINLSDYRYNVTDSIAVIIGKSENKVQMDEITSTISKTRGVKKVISYIQY